MFANARQTSVVICYRYLVYVYFYPWQRKSFPMHVSANQVFLGTLPTLWFLKISNKKIANFTLWGLYICDKWTRTFRNHFKSNWHTTKSLKQICESDQLIRLNNLNQKIFSRSVKHNFKSLSWPWKVQDISRTLQIIHAFHCVVCREDVCTVLLINYSDHQNICK